MGKGRRNRSKRGQQGRRDIQPPRPPAPVVAWTFEFVCRACGHIVNRTTGPPGQPIKVELPHLCPECGTPAPFEETRAARILNVDDYPGGLEGIQIQVRGGSPTGPLLRRFEVKDAIYRETGERFRYQRTYDHENDIYWKRYTNLETGQVEIESTERLSEHRGRGAARPEPTQPRASKQIASDQAPEVDDTSEKPGPNST